MQKLQSDFSASCVEVLLTSTQLVSKLDFQLLSNMDRSAVSDFQPTWSEVDFENYAQVGQNYFLPIDISLENVLTGRENLSATVDFRSL